MSGASSAFGSDAPLCLSTVYCLLLSLPPPLLKLALALFAQLAAFALELGVLRALRDRLARGAFEPLHLGLDAPLDLVHRWYLSGLLLRHEFFLRVFHRGFTSPDS